MKTQCPACQKIFKAPDGYTGRMVHCPDCKTSFVLAEYIPPSIAFEAGKIAQKAKTVAKEHNFIIAAWKKLPMPFKTAFLSTLGVVSAVIVSFYVHQRLLARPAAQAISFEKYKSILSAQGLFPDGLLPQKCILRGRTLTSFCFLPDANKSFPRLELWLDENGNVAGISADWQARISGWPDPELDENSCNWKVLFAFDELTSFNSFSIQEITFKKDEDKTKDIGFDHTKFGDIVITRWQTKQGPQIYYFSATAQTW